MLPWLPGFMPWARLSTQMAGMGRGSFFVPQIGDEVLVAFNHGDVREPYVLGTLLEHDGPAAGAVAHRCGDQAQDPHAARARAAFDEALQSVTLSSEHDVDADARSDEGRDQHAARPR